MIDTITEIEKIYLASSWKNKSKLLIIQGLLIHCGYDVDCFCNTNGRLTHNPENILESDKINAKDFLELPDVQNIYIYNKKMIEWADTVLMILPCGNSSHLEAGYAKGLDKKVYIIGPFIKGEFDAMYGFVDKLYDSIFDFIKDNNEGRKYSEII
ncbi:MAG TPA: hypothetical protein ENG87_00385 [Candidatus Pacearchaeota archaeon]|nr:hypothetical protein [Candidatus Pacearchaeota archaeon]